VIEGWHGDGNFAGTTIMYSLWKSLGITPRPWRPDIRLGAVRNGNEIVISITVNSDWEGDLVFDAPRHKYNLNMPHDWPRINQFPEWFTTGKDSIWVYENLNSQQSETISGEKLISGIGVKLKKGTNQFVLKK
jgi:hypothetical protein